MKHALVIGGSGMLADACLWLADQDYQVTVIGRNRAKLRRLADRNPRIVPVSADYDQEEAFRSALHTSLVQHGPWLMVVAWIHDQDKRVLSWVSEERTRLGNSPWKLFHVLGSRSNPDEMERDMANLAFCSYHQVQLGFVIEQDSSRWLTHSEISGGVIHAIQTGLKRHVVGTLTPWSMRPQENVRQNPIGANLYPNL